MESCPECGSEVINTHNQSVCGKCGLVIHENKYTTVIPVGTVNTPPNSFSYGKGMGGTIQEKGLFALIGKDRVKPWKCPNCKKEFNDMPQRAQLLKYASETNDHPRIASIIKLGKQRARQFGFGEEIKSPRTVMFRQFLGDRLRDVGSLVVFRSSRLPTSDLVDVCFALALKDFYGEEKYREVESRLALNANDLEDFGFLYKVTRRRNH